MINMVIGLTLVKLIESLVYSNGTEGDPIKLMVKRISWNVLYLWILLMVTSRVFILAHFPHQCILAVILGFLCFKLIFNDQTWIYPIWNSTLEKIFMALFLLLSAIFVYVKADDFIGFDINWSIDLAYTYCQNVSSIYLNYTHIFLLIILKFDIHESKNAVFYFGGLYSKLIHLLIFRQKIQSLFFFFLILLQNFKKAKIKIYSIYNSL